MASKANYTYEIHVGKNKSKTIHRCRYKLRSFDDDERMMIFGFTGTGKSFLLERIVKNKGRRMLVVVLDPKGDWELPELTMGVLQNLRSKGAYKLTTLEQEKGDNTYPIKEYDKMAEFLSANMFNRAKYHFTRNKGKPTPCLLVIEEVADVVPKAGKLYDQMPHLAKLVLQGRKYHAGFIGTSQRPADTHTSLTSQSNHIMSFFQSLEHDTKYLKRWFPEVIYSEFKKREIDKISHEFVRFHVNTQKTFHHYRYYLKNGEKN